MSGRDGVESPASGLRMTPRDLAKIGELVRAYGEWRGRPVVPAAWIREMLVPRQHTDGGTGYGYHWYLEKLGGHDSIAAMGNGGQRLVIVPGLALTIAVTCGNYDDPEQWRTPQAVLEQITA